MKAQFLNLLNNLTSRTLLRSLSSKPTTCTLSRLLKNLFTYVDFPTVEAGHAAAVTVYFRVPITMKLRKESAKSEIQIKIIYIRVGTSSLHFV